MIHVAENKNVKKSPCSLVNYFNESISEEVYSFHKSFPDYKPTPLISLHGLANRLGINSIWLKDEARRFDLNAFKVLGASYAIAKLLKEKYDPGDSKVEFSIFENEKIRRQAKNETLVTATDGNHGRGVAWTAKKLGCKCVVYMPSETTRARYQNIKSLGAEVIIVTGNYDYASGLARTLAAENNYLLVQDSSWDGYEKIPLWIMHGYLTLIRESLEQLGNEKPTHIFVQCGVGALPAALNAYLLNRFKEDAPLFAVVEPTSAACVYKSFLAGDGNLHSIPNKMNTIMAGLACGTPSKLAWEILRNHSKFFITCDDDTTTEGMRLLNCQIFNNEKIISGESGAVTTGLIFQLLSDTGNNNLAELLHLGSSSKIFLISTEGDTDPEMYQKIISQ